MIYTVKFREDAEKEWARLDNSIYYKEDKLHYFK